MTKYILILCATIFIASIQGKVLIFTYAFNRPDFIEIQYKTFMAFVEDEYEFIVFNDAQDHHSEKAIQNICNQLNIKHIRIPQEIHRQPYLQRWPGENYHAPAVRNANAVMYSLNTIGFHHDDIVALIESDVFLVKSINISKFMEDYDIAGRFISPSYRIGWQGPITYLWHGPAFLNMKRMPNKHTLNFNCGRVHNTPVDAGGQSAYYMQNNPEIKFLVFDHIFSNEVKCIKCKNNNTPTCTHNTEALHGLGLDSDQITFFQSIHNGNHDGANSVELFYKQSFLHYRCGSNWEGRPNSFHEQKTKALQIYIDNLLKKYTK